MKIRFAIFFFLLAAVCGATTVIPMSVEDLTRGATRIVEGRALETWSAWNPQRTLIYTYTRVQVVRTLKGAATDTLTVKQLGGSAGGYTQKVAGVRHFVAGEDALLFLRPSAANDGTMAVVGLMQGNFRIYQAASGQAMVSNGMPSVSAYRQGRITSFAGGAMPLDEMEARIRKARQ